MRGGQGQGRDGAASRGPAELVTGPRLEEITAKVKAKYGFVTHITKLFGTIVGIVKRNRIPYGDRGVVIDLAADAGGAA